MNRNTRLVITHQTKQISKPLVIFFSLAQLSSGMNFGFFDILGKNLRILANLTSILSFLVTSLVIWLYFKRLWLDSILVSYFVWVFFVLRLSRYTIHKFLGDMLQIDAKWNLVIKNSQFVSKALLYALTWFCVDGSVSLYILKFIAEKEGWSNLAITLWFSCQSIVSISYVLSLGNVIVYRQVYLRINVLKTMLEAKTLRVNDALILFKSLADCFAKIRTPQNNIVSSGFSTFFIL